MFFATWPLPDRFVFGQFLHSYLFALQFPQLAFHDKNSPEQHLYRVFLIECIDYTATLSLQFLKCFPQEKVPYLSVLKNIRFQLGYFVVLLVSGNPSICWWQYDLARLSRTVDRRWVNVYRRIGMFLGQDLRLQSNLL